MKFYTVEETAKMLHCSEKTVRAMASSGELRGAKFGKETIFAESSIAEAYQGRAGRRREKSTYPALP